MPLKPSYTPTRLYNNRVTIKEIAYRTGVSTAAVSFALSGKAGLSDRVRKDICDTAKKMGYAPNKTAQTLNKNNVKIGVMWPGGPDIIQNKFKDGLTEAVKTFSGTKLECILYEYANMRGNSDEIFEDILKTPDFDGLIIAFDNDTALRHEEALARINAKDYPIVTMGNSLRNFLDPVSWVAVDAKMGGRMAADILSMAMPDDRSVLLLPGSKRVHVHTRYIEGFTEGCKNLGLDIRDSLVTGDNPTKAYDLVKTFFAENTVGGIFTTSYLSWSICEALKELGLSGKVKVIGVDLFDKIADCLHDGSLTATLYQWQEQQAKLAFDQLLDAIFDQSYNRRISDVEVLPQIITPSASKAYPPGPYTCLTVRT